MLRKLKFSIEEADTERNMISVKLKEKDQENRLKELKIKELKRKMPHKTLKPLNSDRVMGMDKRKSSTYYPHQVKEYNMALGTTSRRPFAVSGLSKVKSHTHLKVKKKKKLIMKESVVNEINDIVTEETYENDNPTEKQTPEKQENDKISDHTPKSIQEYSDYKQEDEGSQRNSSRHSDTKKHRSENQNITQKIRAK